MAQTFNQRIVVVGAIAYDQISSTSSRLTRTAAPLLNCKLDSLAEAFGGCGGNIAYNLSALGHAALLIATTGTADDQTYLDRLKDLGVSCDGCLRIPGAYCARAVIITDADGHQFTGFYPGPVPPADVWLDHLHATHLPACELFVQAPYPPEMMLAALTFAGHLTQRPLRIWCPGQYADQLAPDQARATAAQCDWIIGNKYEVGHLAAHTDLNGKLVIATNSGQPVEINYPDGTRTTLALASVPEPVDPTGCGDAFTAGLSDTLLNRSAADFQAILLDAVTAGHTQAAKCLRNLGGQQHQT